MYDWNAGVRQDAKRKQRKATDRSVAFSRSHAHIGWNACVPAARSLFVHIQFRKLCFQRFELGHVVYDDVRFVGVFLKIVLMIGLGVVEFV